MAVMAVTLELIRDAQALLAPVIRTTPIFPARYLHSQVGGPVWLKCENLQVAGSFKVRGAYTRMARLSDADRARGVVAASAGNHAQGVALAARVLGIPATVFMPAAAPIPKVAATRSYGAQVELTGETVDEALVAAEQFADSTGAVMIHPFDNEDVVSGQATVGLEIIEQCPQVATVLVCTGGGGLLAGIGAVMSQLRPDVDVIGVQAGAAAAYPPSLQAGHPLPLPGMATMADGIAVGRPGDVPFGIISELGLPIRTVTEDGISRALVASLERSKLLVEPAGAVGLALLLEQPEGIRPPVVVVLSGGNIDPLLLVRVLNHGLVASGRFLDLRVRMADHPGALAAALAHLVPLGANVINVEHVRTRSTLAVNEVDVDLHLETRGQQHCDTIIAGLQAAGLRFVLL